MQKYQIIIDVDEKGSNWHIQALEENDKIEIPVEIIKNIFEMNAKAIEREIIIRTAINRINEMMVNRNIQRNIGKSLKI